MIKFIFKFTLKGDFHSPLHLIQIWTPFFPLIKEAKDDFSKTGVPVTDKSKAKPLSESS
jgi:hypothetical protein